MFRRYLKFRVVAIVGVLAIAAFMVTPKSASAQNEYQIQDVANNLCLNGSIGTTHAELILTACDSANPDTHTIWFPGQPDSVYEWQAYNGLCLNGYSGTAHAEVTLTSCNGSDSHMNWNWSSGGLFQNQANELCLNGSIGTTHAELILTACNSGDHHMDWNVIPVG
jgi:Ricin-type beta-trefoil lectin domain